MELKPIDVEIMAAASQKRELSFNQVVHITHNRNWARRRLDGLLSNHLMIDLRARPGKGFRGRFVLTKTGITVLQEKLSSNLKKDLERWKNSLDPILITTEKQEMDQLSRLINDFGKDKVQVPYEWPRKRPPPPSLKELAERRRRREELIRKARGE